MNSVYKILFLILVLTSFSISCSNVRNVEAIDGILDISRKSIDDIGSVNLSGKWEFYWNQLLTPDDFNSDKQFPKIYVTVPGAWSKDKNKNTDIEKYGFATYRLVVKTNSVDSVFGLRIDRIDVSYKLWVN
jgi:hypothetical protein